MITFLIIGITSVISIAAFGNYTMMDKFIFRPTEAGRGQWYRFFTYGVLHADYTHLIFNMFTLYFFGGDIERAFKATFGGQTGVFYYLLLYVTALPVSILPTYLKQKNNNSYRGVGASGAVSAIIFAYILINPMNFMGVLFIPVWLPAFLFGTIFLLISVSLDKKQSKGINHSAHITGGLYGIAFMVTVFIAFANINLVSEFADKVKIDSIYDLIRIGY
ncbi:MAG: rhomboid family intramembrane serine protease [Petrimonas sp.]|jgi:membrane associated rhomboid family serine protease|uniref:Peptidase S54 rhomboid domain-containing protein n=1 Tax=bioreactor metagenome TaxID=1076179 RepID=A0A645B6Z7_9ZZZZ|nr:rhomboid family intramembrane serine protease [Petrimonas sp.]NLU29129.1 rhomboid family intramembrane serine protease [Bacteroidales bacterium]BBD44901.1 Rhomboid family protein (Precursor) [Petrimonas sp. IBARAKI]HBC37588.1 rhomboid family intramembrane serine protease [Porphyromonadaceae bacterium]MDD2910220.1 rhomboid family intramembrane serine protease [Petrimonas sp.]